MVGIWICTIVFILLFDVKGVHTWKKGRKEGSKEGRLEGRREGGREGGREGRKGGREGGRDTTNVGPALCRQEGGPECRAQGDN